MTDSRVHSFHIPVMGLAYTIDTPVKVARFGISSVISIVEDRLVEMMRKQYYPSIQKTYNPIPATEPDYRAKRITDYLNLVNTIVKEQVEKLQKAAFEAGSEIVKYFEMLPENSTLKQLYREMMATNDNRKKATLEEALRAQIKPGSIDVNIMTKLDRNHFDKHGQLIEDSSDAVAALRGYAGSDLSNSSVVFSAGLNPRLYNYLENCADFAMNEKGESKKKVIIKVSDYRSALIQGKYLAKKGIWVSEFRVESGLNCGGHAFATEGYLLGPILEEFKQNKAALVTELLEIYNAARIKKNQPGFETPPLVSFSVQGGIGTNQEDLFLHEYYQMDSTGWGTPFLLVPEATTVDAETLKLLSAAREKDVVLSHNSPLGVRFHYLKGTSADLEKQERIRKNIPGSPCTEKHLSFNTEFTKEPICAASRQYQKLKLADLQSRNLPRQEYQKQLDAVLAKECLCIGLSNSASINYEQTFLKNRTAVNICPGPNIAHFSKTVSLQTMTDHIYGRTDVVTNPQRPHMFIAELYLYIDYLKEQLEETDELLAAKKKKSLDAFYQNLREGIQYYRNLPGIAGSNQFAKGLYYAGMELDSLHYRFAVNDK